MVRRGGEGEACLEGWQPTRKLPRSHRSRLWQRPLLEHPQAQPPEMEMGGSEGRRQSEGEKERAGELEIEGRRGRECEPDQLPAQT